MLVYLNTETGWCNLTCAYVCCRYVYLRWEIVPNLQTQTHRFLNWQIPLINDALFESCEQTVYSSAFFAANLTDIPEHTSKSIDLVSIFQWQWINPAESDRLKMAPGISYRAIQESARQERKITETLVRRGRLRLSEWGQLKTEALLPSHLILHASTSCHTRSRLLLSEFVKYWSEIRVGKAKELFLL